MHVVAREIEAQAVTAMQFLAGLGLVLAGEFPERGDVGVEDLAAVGQHAGADAVDRRAEVVGIDGGLVGLAVTVGVLEEGDALGLDRQFLDPGLAEVAPDAGEEVHLIPVGEVVLEGPHVVADIEDAGAVTVGLGDKDAAVLVEIEGDGVGQQGLGGPERGLEAGGQLHAGQGLLGFFGGRLNLGGADARLGLELAAGGRLGGVQFGRRNAGQREDKDQCGSECQGTGNGADGWGQHAGSTVGHRLGKARGGGWLFCGKLTCRRAAGRAG